MIDVQLKILQQHKALLSGVSIVDLLEKVRSFRRLNVRTLSDQDLQAEIQKVLQVGNEAMLRIPYSVFPKGTDFFRARRAADLILPIGCARIAEDAWAPPSACVQIAGRLNKIGEPLLYTCVGNVTTPLRELRLREGDCAAMFAFRATKEVQATTMGVTDLAPGYTSDERAKINIITDFLYNEFTREVGQGTEHLYRPAEMIAKSYFDMPIQDAWVYPSVQSRSSMNAVFRPEAAKSCLSLRGVMLGVVDPDGHFLIKGVGIAKDGIFNYYRPDAEEARSVFPQLGSNRQP